MTMFCWRRWRLVWSLMIASREEPLAGGSTTSWSGAAKLWKERAALMTSDRTAWQKFVAIAPTIRDDHGTRRTRKRRVQCTRGLLKHNWWPLEHEVYTASGKHIKFPWRSKWRHVWRHFQKCDSTAINIYEVLSHTVSVWLSTSTTTLEPITE